MKVTGTILKPIVALAALLSLIAAWGMAFVTMEARAEQVLIGGVEQATPSLPAVTDLGASQTTPPRTPTPDEPTDAEDEQDSVPEWRVLGSAALEHRREQPTRGFLRHRVLHFTFDDGPHPDTTPRLLDAMAEYGVTGTFFVVGQQLDGARALERRALLQRMEVEGHTVATHTNGHHDLSRMSAEQIGADLERVEAALEATLGYRPGVFRPPFGRRSALSNLTIHERGYTQVLWNYPVEEGTRRSDGILRNFRTMLDRMERHHRGPGGIVLLHDPSAESVDAFSRLMDELRARNCELLDQDGEELWVVAGDLAPFLIHEQDGELPEELFRELQTEARRQAERYCIDDAQSERS